MASPMWSPLKSMSLHTDPYCRSHVESCEAYWRLYHWEGVLSMHLRRPISGGKSCRENRDLLCGQRQVSHMGYRRILVLQFERSLSLPLSGTEKELRKKWFLILFPAFCLEFQSFSFYDPVFILISDHLNHLLLPGSPSSNCSLNTESLQGNLANPNNVMCRLSIHSCEQKYERFQLPLVHYLETLT